MKKRCVLIIILLMISIRANATVLYDGSLNNGTDTPDEQGWEYITDPFFGNLASQTASQGMTTLDTTATTNIQAGYFSRNPLSGQTHPGLDGETLDRHLGYELNFAVRLNSESHSNSNRSGFSVIVLGDDLMGIELGFWTDEIWAQSGKPSDDELFIHSEGINFDTTFMTDYNLSIFGDTYTLFVDTTQILSGQLRNYSDWTNPIPNLGSFPYDSPNFLFFGDDTFRQSQCGYLTHRTKHTERAGTDRYTFVPDWIDKFIDIQTEKISITLFYSTLYLHDSL